MAEIIRQYAPNSDEYVKLSLASSELTKQSTKGTAFYVDDCYFDLGQDWMWTTIIARRTNGDSWQALCPRDYEKILLSTDIPATVSEIMADKYWYE